MESGENFSREQYWIKTSLCPSSPLNIAAGKKEVLVTMDREKAAWAVYHWDAGIPPDVGSHGAETHPMGPRSPPSSEIRPRGVSKASQRGVDNRDQLVACTVGQVSLVAQIIKNLPAMWETHTVYCWVAGAKRVFMQVLKELTKGGKKKDDHNSSHTCSLRRYHKRDKEPRLQ